MSLTVRMLLLHPLCGRLDEFSISATIIVVYLACALDLVCSSSSMIVVILIFFSKCLPSFFHRSKIETSKDFRRLLTFTIFTFFFLDPNSKSNRAYYAFSRQVSTAHTSGNKYQERRLSFEFCVC
jgi:hypothetical protein